MCANHTLHQYNQIKRKEIKMSRNPADTELRCRNKLQRIQREKQLDSQTVWSGRGVGLDRAEHRRFRGV